MAKTFEVGDYTFTFSNTSPSPAYGVSATDRTTDSITSIALTAKETLALGILLNAYPFHVPCVAIMAQTYVDVVQDMYMLLNSINQKIDFTGLRIYDRGAGYAVFLQKEVFTS